MVRIVLRQSASRLLIRPLIAAQVLLGIPVAAASLPSPPPALVPAISSSPAPPPPQVTVNRTVPKVTPPPVAPEFSAVPTVAEIFRARVFSEPVVPVGGEPTAIENRAVADLLTELHRGTPRWRELVARFLMTHRTSPWTPSLLANVATLYARDRNFSRALEAWDEAYQIAKEEKSAYGRAVADFALAEWLTLASRFGNGEQVMAKLKEAERRTVSGTAASNIARVRENLAIIRDNPKDALACGAEAILALLRLRGMREPTFLTEYVAQPGGTSLLEMRDLARGAGLPVHMVTRDDAKVLPTPAIVHLKVGHYVTVTERTDNRYHVIDKAIGGSYWMSDDVLFQEMSGFALFVGTGTASGWKAANNTDAAAVMGSGPVCPDRAPPPPPPCDSDCPSAAGGGSGPGMAIYRFEPVTASLILHDSPVGYSPPRGPSVPLTFSYHHRNVSQPQTFAAGNVGPKWSFAWLRFVQEVPTDALGITPPHVWVMQPPAGREVFSNPDTQGVFPAHWSSRAVLVRVSENPLKYERRLRDGTVEVYGLSNNAPVGQRRVAMTELIDPLQQKLEFTWDAQGRLLAIEDAIGQVTTLSYDHSTDPLKITKVTDPFGRFATVTYNGAGQLESITDVIGLTSRFTYGPEDFITTLTTPYGTTTFRQEPRSVDIYSHRFIEATDPLGGTEHLSFEYSTPALPATESGSEVPTGFAAHNTDLNKYNTFYWSKRAWMLGANDKSKAAITHWMGREEYAGWQVYSYAPHSVKKPLESRVWYAYPGQQAGSEHLLDWFATPSAVARVLDDGSTQTEQTTYNLRGSVLTRTDPLGRQTTNSYAADGITLVQVRQTGSVNDVLATYGDFTAHQQPQTITDAAGEVTTVTYNAAGQMLTTTNAKAETTTYTYDALGKLTTVAGPVAGATTTYGHDTFGRVVTVTDSDGGTVTLSYDALNRTVRTTYPDSTYEETTYERLDPVTSRDREGRVTRRYYDALRRLTATRDPLGRVVAQEWCPCGSMDALIDANGNRTTWERDLHGRVIREVRADNVTDTLYTYGARSGRLLTVTDPKDQVATYTYAADDQVVSTVFTNAVIATPSVSFAYDAAYGRVTTMQDGTGSTTYTYHPVGFPGAGQVASVDGPLGSDLITYEYDELGRVTSRAINGSANIVTWAFDALGRVTSEQNMLGTFTYTYDSGSPRIATVTYPNTQTSTYTYFPAADDHRLQTIHHKYPSGATLSKFDYTYDAAGNILTWRQQADSTAVEWEYLYDLAGQLLGATKWSTDASPVVLGQYAYAYDAAGNRTAEQVGDQVTGASYDGLNRLVSQQPSGPIVFAGTTNEPATVTVQRKSAASLPGNGFRATPTVTSGTTLVPVVATDSSGNIATQVYEVDGTGSSRMFTYDANGNLIGDGIRTLEWDARNQLVAVTVGSHRSEFTYDGEQQRVRVVEKEDGVVESDTKAVWCGGGVCEERDGISNTVIRRSFKSGEAVAGAFHFFAGDHLETTTSLTNASAQMIAQYAFDPWGRRSVTAGLDATRVGFTGHQWNAPAGVWLTQYRAYDPSLGRWLSADPGGMRDGPNLYAYVANRPTQAIDPLGLQLHVPGPPPSALPPPGCEAAGPWTYVSRGLVDRVIREKWEKDTDFTLKYQSHRTKMPRGAGSITIGICWVYYKKVGIVEVVRSYELWKRETTCCNEKSVQYGRTFYEASRDVPYIDDGRTRRTAVQGVVVDGQCFTGRKGPS